MTTQQMLDERYGRRTSKRRRIIGWSIVAIVAFSAIGALGWTTIARAIDTVEAVDTGYTTVDARTVSVSFQITAPVGRDVACAIEAQDEEHGVVGWRVVEIPASEERLRAFTETVPTLAEATTGFVNSCWVT